MITKSQVKHIKALADKKYRTEAGEFVVEGEKLIEEVLSSSWFVRALFAHKAWLEHHKNDFRLKGIPIYEVDDAEMERISFLKSPGKVLGLLQMPSNHQARLGEKALLLDTLQDPGNLGTIMRIADWFGIQSVYLYGACADPFQPKCIQSTMGSFLRVQGIPVEDIHEIARLPYVNKFAALLHGSVPDNQFIHQSGLLMIGNESKGLNPELQSLCTHAVTIPQIGVAESLNAAVATGILCYAWIC